MSPGSSLFLAYLRGIETERGVVRIGPDGQFLAYLRGIETFITNAADRVILRFLAYLRGIETAVRTLARYRRGVVPSLPTRD